MSRHRAAAPVTLRRATAADAALLAALAERTFRDAFTAQNTASDMAMFCAASYGEALQAAEIADRSSSSSARPRSSSCVAAARRCLVGSVAK